MVGGLSSGTFKLDALDKFGNAVTTADTTLNRVSAVHCLFIYCNK